MDIWRFIAHRNIPPPALYFATERDVIDRDGMLFAVNQFTPATERDTVQRRLTRYRTIGDANLTACVPSDAATIDDVLTEVETTRLTERGATRGDDRVSDTAMEDRKKEGYF